MKLYSLNDTISVTDPESGEEYSAGDSGSFDLPDELGTRLHAIHFDGQPVWETDGERSLRLVAEEDARRRDPATLLAEIEAIRRQLSGSSTAADIRAAAEKAAKDAEELAKQADAAEEAEALASDQADKQAQAAAEQVKEEAEKAEKAAKTPDAGLPVSDALTPSVVAEVPEGAPAPEDSVNSINDYLTGIKDTELYASERARLIDGQERKGLVEGPHAEAESSDLL